MHGGHHEPSVFTHFFPGLLAGVVVGGMVGALVIAHIATSSLQLFWESTRQRPPMLPGVCADASGVRMSTESGETEGTLTSLTIGNGEETLLTVASTQLRYVPVTETPFAYLTAVASVDQQEAFPATSLYRINYCQKTLDHVLGGNDTNIAILGMNSGGTWVVYMNEEEQLMLMNTRKHEVMVIAGEEGQPKEIIFSPGENGGALVFANGNRSIWSFEDNNQMLTQTSVSPGATLPVWTFQSPQEYAAMLE
jgi:hypothetical protein